MTTAQPPQVGDEIELDIGPVAHGGHCVARWDGRVVFVRHTLPGERVVVRITDTTHAGYFRGDAVRVLAADPRRVTPRCGHFGPGGCGGCDFQHAEPSLQRELKAAVVAEQLSRLAGIDRQVTVEPLTVGERGAGDHGDDGDGYGWRTRVRWALDDAGRIGPRATRSHRVVGISALHPCEIAAPELSAAVDALDVPPAARGSGAGGGRNRGRQGSARARGTDRRGRGRRGRTLPQVSLLRGTDADPIAVWDGAPAPSVVETAAGRRFTVAADGFWQAHPAAADTLANAVDRALDGFDLAGRSAWDLYGGVGLFAAVLAARVGPDGSVLTIESDAAATELAAQNLADLPQVAARAGRVEHLVADLPATAAAIVLDPPRSGAGRAVCAALAAREPVAIVYVACDPAALARDTAVLAEHGYALDTLRAFDCFPQTHHVECVARFIPA